MGATNGYGAPRSVANRLARVGRLGPATAAAGERLSRWAAVNHVTVRNLGPFRWMSRQRPTEPLTEWTAA